jgi:hypothetical protein
MYFLYMFAPSNPNMHSEWLFSTHELLRRSRAMQGLYAKLLAKQVALPQQGWCRQISCACAIGRR